MSSNTRQIRYNSILQANIEKIINEGIRYNINKLDQCSTKIDQYKVNGQKDLLMKEQMNARLIIQQLKANLNELEKCYLFLKDFELSQKYDELISSLKNDVLNRISAFIKTNDQINTIINNESLYSDNESNVNSNIAMQIQGQAAQLTNSRQRLKEMESLNQDLKELNLLVTNFANLVQEQQAPVDNIEQNITETEVNVTHGTRSLIKASAMTVAPITCAAVSGAIFGPIGAFVGFKLSTGIASALSASAVTYSFAKFVQNKNKKNAEIELEKLKTN